MTGPTELRHHPRYRARFRSFFSSPRYWQAGEGELRDLSVRGCRISCPTPLSQGMKLELCICLIDHDQEWPLVIERAQVCWADPNEFGVEFLKLSDDAPDRIRRCIRTLEGHKGH